MITRIPVACQAPEPVKSWKQELSEAITSLPELLDAVGLSHRKDLLNQADGLFSLRVPWSFVKRMEYGNAEDPLLLQVLPQQQEFIQHPDFTDDPLDEQDTEIPGLIRKYKSRALLTFTGVCAINCRYCFRRTFPYTENRIKPEDWQKTLDYLTNAPEINEVILSGGDPLIVSDYKLKKIIQDLEAIPHIKRLRIHSRLPIVLPSRITDSLIDLLAQSSLQTVMVIHCNHPQELDDTVKRILGKMKRNGIELFNQTVILRKINNNLSILRQLSEKLFDSQVIPYYLHTLDKVRGTSHFDLPLEQAQELYQGLLRELAGFLVPKLVKEEAGKASKTPIW